MTKYCCDKFKMQLSFNKEQGLNIRIIKFKPDDLVDKSNLYRFFITPGYTEADRAVPTLNIAFCPFCGRNLFKYYKEEKYVNEYDDSFLYP